jgi:hypothetical protein
VDPRDGVDVVARKKIPSLCRESKSGRPARSLVTILTELPPYEQHLYSNLLVKDHENLKCLMNFT